MARNLLKSMGVPTRFWGEAVTTAVYLLNRAPTRSVKKITPYEEWHGRKPTVHHLRIFGCTGHVKRLGPGQTKLADRSKQMVLIGYEKGSKAYRMYDPDFRKLVVTRDVVFEESRDWDWSTTGSEDDPTQEPLFVSYASSSRRAEAESAGETAAEAEKTVTAAAPRQGCKTRKANDGASIPFDLSTIPSMHVQASGSRDTPYSEPSHGPQDVFNAFRDDSGGFRADHNREVDDIGGLISLYEASYLAFPGEAMLDEARVFAIKKLQELTPSMEPCQSERVGCVLLDLPLHWTPPRLQAIWSLKQRRRRRSENVDSGEEESYRWDDPSILQLAAADFNLVQEVHRAELVELTEWWKETGLGEKLTFARDRLVECFFCVACIAPEPRRAGCREVLAKAGSLVVHLDDVYDIYGTLNELAAFTDAIGGAWDDETTVAALPEYMKAMYSAIRSTSTAAADRVTKDQGYDVLPLYKEAWRELCKAFLVEAKWQYESYKPGLDEYLNNGWITSTGPLLLLHAFPMLQDGVIEYPRMVELSSRIFRLCNDLATHETESERGDAPSAIACRMAEGGASEGEARQAVKDAIAETWKELNREACSVGGGGWSAASVNLARIIHCIYHDGDGITSPTDSRKQLVKDLLFNPIICLSNDR